MTGGDIFDILMLLTIITWLTGIAMMIATAVYLNTSNNRFRIFELGYSKESEWYRTGKVDFFTANHLMGFMPLAAFRMRGGWRSERARQLGTPLAPYLHINNNYKKLLNEFPKFAKWVTIKFIMLFIGAAFGVAAYGMDANWW
jgi:hypothetical protein